jgi:hypothetical protein
LASFEFTLELNRDIIDSEAKSIKSSCGDAIIKMIPTGIDTGYTGTLVEFDREAESLEKAIESAVTDVEAVADLRATGITIPAPERDETAAAAPEASAAVEPADAQPDASAEPAAKTAKKPAAKKASPRKPSTRKASTRKVATAEKPDPVAAE